MLTRAKLQAGEGTLEPYNSEIGHAHRRRNMDANDARIEMEANFHKVFYMMADKVDKLFADYEERMAKERKGSEVKKEDKEVKDEGNASVNQGGGGEEPPEPPSSPSASSTSSSASSSSHSQHSKVPHKEPQKKPLLKLDVKFDLPMFNGEANAEKLNNWIRQIEIYC